MRHIILSLPVLFLLACNQQVTLAPAHVATKTVTLEGYSTPIRFGGYGSSVVYNAMDSCFYMLTDRGPNVDGVTSESKIFPVSAYTPSIGRFRLLGDSLLLVENISLTDNNGQPFTGLPNQHGDGVTGEIAYNIVGEVVIDTTRGLDTEGLAIAPDGTFWVSDEYAPFVMQFDRNGRLLRELSPSKGLPAYFAQRRPNRGMEGLTISKNGKQLYGIMQSPLYLPDNTTKDVSVNNRIIQIDLHSGETREFIYAMENPENVVSEICLINDSVMLVLERDGRFPKSDKGFKRVYKINIGPATDVSNRAIEMLSPNDLMEQNIACVEKELFVDLLIAIPGYRHDKPEGITMLGDSILCVANDDDFGITTSGDGGYLPKTDALGLLDRNMLYFIRVQYPCL